MKWSTIHSSLKYRPKTCSTYLTIIQNFNFSFHFSSTGQSKLEIWSWISTATTMVRSTTKIREPITIRVFECNTSSWGHLVARHVLHNAWWFQGSINSNAFCLKNLSKWYYQLFDEVTESIKPIKCHYKFSIVPGDTWYYPVRENWIFSHLTIHCVHFRWKVVSRNMQSSQK